MLKDSLRNYEADQSRENLFTTVIDARREGKALFSITKFGAILFCLIKDNKLRIDKYDVHYQGIITGNRKVLSKANNQDLTNIHLEGNEFIEIYSFEHSVPDYYGFDRFERLERYYDLIKKLVDIPKDSNLKEYTRLYFDKYEFIYKYGDDFIEIPVLDYGSTKWIKT